MSKYPLFTPVQYKGESTYGTTSSPDTAIGSVQNITPTNANNFTYIRGTNREVQKAIYGTYTAGLTGSFILHDFIFLRHFIGPYSAGSDTEGDPKTLTTGDVTSLSDSTGIQAFSLEIGNAIDDSKTVYTGCQGNDFTISGNLGQALTVGFNIIAQKVTDSPTATAYTEPSTQPWVFSQATIKFDDTPTSIAEVQSFTINYSNNLIQHWSAGNGRFMKQPLIGVLDITFTINVRASDSVYQNLRDDFYGASNSPIVPTSSATAVTTNEFLIELSEGTTRHADIHLDEAVIESISDEINITGENVVNFTITGRAFKGESSIPIKWWSGART